MLKFFANFIWIHTPHIFQKEFSRIFSVIFHWRISQYFIKPYCFIFDLKKDYLNQFMPASNNEAYKSYSDFFRRRLKLPPILESNTIWPCEGYLCDWGSFHEKQNSLIKGQRLDLNSVFKSEKSQTKNHFFLNVFLHNHNYHRVHSPISGTITNITRIPGDLIFLRPWFYQRKEVSYPAIRNERVVFEITDHEQRPWYLAMVGGFGVGTIELLSGILNGKSVSVGQEIAKFNLGSTVCLASPVPVLNNKFLAEVKVGQKLETHDSSSKLSPLKFFEI